MSRAIRITSAVIVTALVVITVIALVQLQEQKLRVEEAIGLTTKGSAGVAKLVNTDGLVEFPELGDRNTAESRVNATFLTAQMVSPKSASVVNDKTTDSLHSYGIDAKNPVETRLKAFAALKLLNDFRWKESASLIASIKSMTPKTVSYDTLPNYLALAEPLNLLDDSFSKAKLIRFDATQNEQTERLAASALTLSYLFDNKEQIIEYFSAIKPKLCNWADGNSQHVQQILISANALLGTKDARCIIEEKEFIKSYTGCENSSLVRLNKEEKSGCSLMLTYYAWRASLWR